MSKDSIELALSVLKAEKANLTLDHFRELDELKTDTGKNVRADLKGTFETADKTEEKRELSPEQADKLINTLKTRFEASDNEELRNAIDFADVEKALRASPEDLYALDKLKDGKPEVVGMDGDEFVFEDRSAESPAGRRNLNFDEADAQRKSFGSNVEFQSEESYRAMQKIGKYDLRTGSWLKTSAELRKTGVAVFGDRGGVDVRVDEDHAGYRDGDWGWRAALRVKKV